MSKSGKKTGGAAHSRGIRPASERWFDGIRAVYGVIDQLDREHAVAEAEGLSCLIDDAASRHLMRSQPLKTWAKKLGIGTADDRLPHLMAAIDTVFAVAAVATILPRLPEPWQRAPQRIRQFLAGRNTDSSQAARVGGKIVTCLPRPFSWFVDAFDDFPDLQGWTARLSERRSDAGEAGGTCADDLCRSLYETIVPKAVRLSLGEFYTPSWLAEHVLANVVPTRLDDRHAYPLDGAPLLIDPCCGSGVFLLAAIRRLTAGGIDDLHEADWSGLMGIDIHRPAVLAARLNVLAALASMVSPATAERLPRIRHLDFLGQFGTASAELGGDFRLVVGNPPWLVWDSLPESRRTGAEKLWRRFGLFTLDGTAARHGGAKKDLASLVVLAAAESLLADGGRLAMLVPRSLLHAKGAAEGFRRALSEVRGTKLRLTAVDDFSAVSVFPRTTNRTAVLYLEKGKTTQFPVPYRRWSEDEGDLASLACTLGPIDSTDPGRPWLILPDGVEVDAGRILSPSAYRGSLGANTAGANGVYWVEIVGRRDGLPVIRNLGDASRPPFPIVETPIEPTYLYPLLRWGDVQRFRARPSAWILLPQDVRSRRGVPQEQLETESPRTAAYLRHFEGRLRTRAAYRRFQHRAAWYSMYNVGPNTPAEWKVVWRRMDRSLQAAAVGPIDDPYLGRRPVIPQETCVFVPCDDADEAHYLAAFLNSSPVRFVVGHYSLTGSKGFGSPHILDVVAVTRFDRENDDHRRLSELGREATAAEAVDRQERLLAMIDAVVARLWGLTERTVAIMQDCLGVG
ncbi:hypothetical protein JCM19992_13200 [Thermostilla marina]